MGCTGQGRDRTEDRDRIVYHKDADSQEEAELSTAILMALDSLSGFDIESSDTVVFDHIDLDALDELFGPVGEAPRHGQITFAIDQYEVTVTAAGAVTIRARSEPGE